MEIFLTPTKKEEKNNHQFKYNALKNMNVLKNINDKWIGYYFIPFAAIFVYYIGDDSPFYSASFKANDLFSIALNIMSGLIIWKIIKKVIFSFLKEELSLIRFFKAFFLNLFASLLFLIVVRFLHDIFINKIQTNIEFYTLELPTDALFVLIINLIYLILLYKRKVELIQYSRTTEFKRYKKISIQSSKKSYSFFPSDIAFIELEHKICFLYTYSGEKIVTVHSLNEIFQKLPNRIFFQCNRQFLVHRDVIKSYQLTATRKLKIQLVSTLELDKDIFISKAKSSAFKNWFLDKQNSKNKSIIFQDS